jgi:glycerol-3-phosphate acyltransferase PlsY
LNAGLGGLVLLVWLSVAYLSRYSSLAAIIAALAAPLLQMMLWGSSPQTLAIGLMSLLLIWRHVGNIQKLIAGTESKIGQKAGAAATTVAAGPRHAAKRRGAK